MRRLLLLLAVAAVAALGGRASLDGNASGGEAMTGRITKVTDGDTLHVRVGSRDERVRLLGIDTPEVYGTPMCGGAEASASMKRLVRRHGRRVRLITDPSQDRRDRYDRLLAYVEADGTDLGRAQVRAGWADVYVFDDRPFERVASYRSAARRARDEHRGVNARCGGDFERPL